MFHKWGEVPKRCVQSVRRSSPVRIEEVSSGNTTFRLVENVSYRRERRLVISLEYSMTQPKFDKVHSRSTRNVLTLKRRTRWVPGTRIGEGGDC